MLVLVFLQWSGDYHGGQSALYPAAALHGWCAPVAPHLRCHCCNRLWWECTPHGQRFIFLRDDTTFFFFFSLPFASTFHPIAINSSVTATWDGSVSPCCICFLASILTLNVFQVSGTVTGSTEVWAGSQALTSPSLISASTQTSAYTCSSAKLGSSLVSCHLLTCLCSTLPCLSVKSVLFFFLSAVISLSVIEAIIVMILIFLRMRLRIAIALLKEGSKYVWTKILWYPEKLPRAQSASLHKCLWSFFF